MPVIINILLLLLLCLGNHAEMSFPMFIKIDKKDDFNLHWQKDAIVFPIVCVRNSRQQSAREPHPVIIIYFKHKAATEFKYQMELHCFIVLEATWGKKSQVYRSKCCTPKDKNAIFYLQSPIYIET